MTTNRVDGLMAQEDAALVGGVSPAIQTVEAVIYEIARTNIPVLLVGESGTGKELFANRVHQLSAQSEKFLKRISCAAMNPAAFSSELARSTDGKKEVGTIFFDEISELDSICQRSLLCELPDGDAGARRGLLKARVVSTTTRNLDEEIRAGRFRSELFYRINGVCLRLPPLRERKEDIPLLADFFLTKHAAQMSRARPSVSPRTLQAILDYSWPGNVRELENVMKKIVVLGDEQLAIAELRASVSTARKAEATTAHGHSLKAAARAASREAERELILKALARTRWNRKRAAQDLQISYKSLLYKLKQIGFDEMGVNP
jgi:two-component system, NtrC family, response regulator AtoC